MKNPTDARKTSPKESRAAPANNRLPARRESSPTRTPDIQSVPNPKPQQAGSPKEEDKPPQVTMMRFPISESGGKVVVSDVLAEIRNWIGRSVVVKPKKGVQQQGVLIEVSSDGLRLEKEMTAGSISLPFKFEEIDAIETLR